MSEQNAAQEATMDPNSLYREEIFTDRRVGTLRRLTPVTPQGEPDGARPVIYMGQAQLYTAVGTLPLSFEIDAASLEEAAQKFPDAAQAAVERTMEELKEMQREAASSIVVPGQGGGGGGMGGMGGMGGPGGGLQMP